MSNDAAVLLIDDDEMVRRAFRRALERGGLAVIEAEDGASGLQMARDQVPGAVMLDLRMPGMDGLDVLSDLLRDDPERPVVVVSGQGTMTDAVEALRRGAWDFVSKPVMEPSLLVRTVRRALEKAALLRQNREYSESLRRMNEQLSAALEEVRTDQQAARQLQFQLLPPDGLCMTGYTCSRRLFPSQLMSGDFLDYFPLGPDRLGLYVADVAGHGAASAFMTAILSTLVDKYRELFESRSDETILDPDQLLTRLDADLVPLQLKRHVTMFYAVLERASGKLVYGNAGAFPFPLLADGNDVTELECAGRPLNLPCSGGFGRGETVFRPGGRLLIASDGVLELPPKQTHKARRESLARLLSNSWYIDSMLAELGLHDGTPLSDDVAFLFLKRESTNA